MSHSGQDPDNAIASSDKNAIAQDIMRRYFSNGMYFWYSLGTWLR